MSPVCDGVFVMELEYSSTIARMAGAIVCIPSQGCGVLDSERAVRRGMRDILVRSQGTV